jgi:hypothetical protein
MSLIGIVGATLTREIARVRDVDFEMADELPAAGGAVHDRLS